MPVKSISVQVALCGYLSRTGSDKVGGSSEWVGADRFFTDSKFQKRYDEVRVSVFSPKFTLVPEHFFNPLSARSLLAEVADLKDDDQVACMQLPDMKAVLVYSNSIGESLSRVVAASVLRADGTEAGIFPEIYFMLRSLESIPEYNKVVAAVADGYLYLVISQGRSLLLCNSYSVPDFTTAEYFLFMSMKRLQLNMEMTTVYFRTPLTGEEEMSLYRYFKAVDYI